MNRAQRRRAKRIERTFDADSIFLGRRADRAMARMVRAKEADDRPPEQARLETLHKAGFVVKTRKLEVPGKER